jgi:uncharacterized protein (DUF4415 family)
MQTIKTRSGRVIVLPTDEEAEEIRRGIDSDPDTMELTNKHFKNAVPFSGTLKETLRRVRGRGKKPAKVQTAIRFDPEVLAALKSTGRGWQTRVNEVMKEWVATYLSVKA